jgi:hypothetical protein
MRPSAKKVLAMERPGAKIVLAMERPRLLTFQDNNFVYWVRFCPRRTKYFHVSRNSLLFVVKIGRSVLLVAAVAPAKKYFDGLFARSASSFSLVSSHR